MMTNTELRQRQEIEKALGSLGRIKILGVFCKSPDDWLTIYLIAKNTTLDATKVKRNLMHLVETGWVEAYDGPLKKYRLNQLNPVTHYFKEFLERSGYLSS